MDWDLATSLKYLHDNKHPPFGIGACAANVNAALKAGNITLPPVPKRWQDATGSSACDYGAALEKVGFEVFYDNTEETLLCAAYHPVKGDIAIFMPIQAEGSGATAIRLKRHGHIQMFDGTSWVSDFEQKTFWVGKDYRLKWGRFRIYRFTNLMTKASNLKVEWSK